jgi:hypothetical protein
MPICVHCGESFSNGEGVKKLWWRIRLFAIFTNKLGYLNAYVYTLLASEYKNKISHKLINRSYSLIRR